MAEGETAGGAICESLVDPARSEIPGTYDKLHAREPRDLVVARWFVGDAPSWMVRGVGRSTRVGREGNAEAVIP